MVKPIVLTDDLPPTLLNLIGRVVVSFGQLEHLLAVLVKRELELSFSEGMAEAEKLNTIQALRDAISHHFALRSMNQAQEAKVDSALGEVKRLYGARHDVVHGLFAKTIDGEVIYRRRGRSAAPKLDELLADTRRVIATLNTLIPPRQLV